MKGVLLKECYAMKPYVRRYLLSWAFLIVLGVAMKSPVYIMAMLVIMGINVQLATFPVDEAGGYEYMLACPLGRSTMVRGKYVVQFAVAAAILLFSVAGKIIDGIVNRGGDGMWLPPMLLCLGVYFIYTSILIPVIYRCGAEKARITMFVIVAVPAILALLGGKALESQDFLWIDELGRALRAFPQNQLALVLSSVFLAASLLAAGGSYLVSVRIFERMEF